MLGLVFASKSDKPDNVFDSGQDTFRDPPLWPILRVWLLDGLLICGAVVIAWAVLHV